MRNALVSGNALLHVRPVLGFLVAMGVGIAAGSEAHADELPTGGHASRLKTEHFDHDPGWEGRNNRVIPKEYLTVVQAFGYSQTHFAGAAAGEMGGQVWRASEPAYYGDKIGPRTLDDNLSASGTFALTKTSPGSGLFFGFFRAQQPGAGGRPIGSLGMHLDCERSGARLAVRLITGQNQSCGTFITPFIPGKFRPTPLKNDGTRYTWKLDYDPDAADGRGQCTFMIRGDAESLLDQPDLPEAHRQEARIRFPNYADKVEPLSLADRLEARGRVVLVVGGPDSDMCFGWFRSNDSVEAPNKAGEFLGIKVGGPTRAGHYFLPAFTVNEQVRGLPDQGPVLLPGKTYEWSVVYNPAANDGQGSIAATLGDESVTLRLRQGQRRKAEVARFDRFGLFSIGPGGQIVKLYLDDLEYTAASRL